MDFDVLGENAKADVRNDGIVLLAQVLADVYGGSISIISEEEARGDDEVLAIPLFCPESSESNETSESLFCKSIAVRKWEWENSDDENSGDTTLSTELENSNFSRNRADDSVKDDSMRKRRASTAIIPEHIKTIPGNPQMYQCTICTKQFQTKQNINYHVFCKGGQKPFTCAQCGKGFIIQSHYQYHLRTHTGELPFPCQSCDKAFKQRSKLTLHTRTHTGEKPFSCERCGRRFASAQNLRTHYLIHSRERPFACEHCSRRFTGMTNLKKHMRTHTGEKPFSCVQCNKRFGLKWTLDLHLRIHSNKRPFDCKICARDFISKKDLIRHQTVHSDEAPFKCQQCGRAFKRKDNLKRHTTVTCKSASTTAVIQPVGVTSSKEANSQHSRRQHGTSATKSLSTLLRSLSI